MTVDDNSNDTSKLLSGAPSGAQFSAPVVSGFTFGSTTPSTAPKPKQFTPNGKLP